MSQLGQESSFIEIVKADNFSLKANSRNQSLKLELLSSHNPQTSSFKFCFDSLKESNKQNQKVSDFTELVEIIKNSTNRKVDIQKMQMTAFIDETSQLNPSKAITIKFENKSQSNPVSGKQVTKCDIDEDVVPNDMKQMLVYLIKEIKQLKKSSQSNFQQLTQLIKNQTKQLINQSETKIISIFQDFKKDFQTQISQNNISIPENSKTPSIPAQKKMPVVQKKIETPKKQMITTKLKGSASNFTSGLKKVEQEAEMEEKKVKKCLIQSKDWVHPDSYYYKRLNLTDNTIYHSANVKKSAYVFGPQIINEPYQLTFIVKKFDNSYNYFGICDIAHRKRQKIYFDSKFTNIIGMNLYGSLYINNLQTDTPRFLEYDENKKIKMTVNLSQGYIQWVQESNNQHYRHESQVLKDKSITWAPFFWLDGKASLAILK